MMFSLILSTLLYNAFLVAQIKYGNVVITKLTLIPYHLSMAFVTLFLLSQVIEEYIDEDLLAHGSDWVEDRSGTSRRLWILFYWIRSWVFMLFIGFRIFEDQMLQVFVDF